MNILFYHIGAATFPDSVYLQDIRDADAPTYTRPSKPEAGSECPAGDINTPCAQRLSEESVELQTKKDTTVVARRGRQWQNRRGEDGSEDKRKGDRAHKSPQDEISKSYQKLPGAHNLLPQQQTAP